MTHLFVVGFSLISTFCFVFMAAFVGLAFITAIIDPSDPAANPARNAQQAKCITALALVIGVAVSCVVLSVIL